LKDTYLDIETTSVATTKLTHQRTVETTCTTIICK